jgi:hypothetical protein
MQKRQGNNTPGLDEDVYGNNATFAKTNNYFDKRVSRAQTSHAQSRNKIRGTVS